ncbi:MAG: DNA starvation/stationary phase protection protein [Lactococcus sp.]|jgi:starvation-inducible DNA-binding protein|uniref:DNA protection during starvation protein Dps n=3 Tax=Pseudolactococcus TaxID=3436058 RepID=A0A0D6DXV7_9LACT|nr:MULTISPECIES: Dps family protein [Lactococcus]MBR6896046.1 DNA starvation/stationary phase protection protein [Lactococcus sp.]MCJ1968466.1 DNA starvation/stationary phase protection protein [Lactococcus carnosus]MCJ1970926.1 DNA starvation/stationary phase protection protein [Lactococcus carnosus]MCJ1988775.1 DNA starvation/stationary phase protection protein [Lactococcus carnosus]MCJ1995736.1 DNA starvation/stationary phase protection protein [Lactococcus carnosus]
MSREKTKAVLNQSVADLSKAAALVHQVHWYLRGPGFMKLHPKMDELMAGLNGYLDELSERLITIGGSPVSTLKEFDELSKIDMAPAAWGKSTEERLTEVVKAYKYLSDLFQDGIDATDEEHDAVTNDIFTSAKGAIEKTVWMLESELGLAPGL